MPNMAFAAVLMKTVIYSVLLSTIMTYASGSAVLSPQRNITVFENCGPVIFNCSGSGDAAKWKINGSDASSNSGIRFGPIDPLKGVLVPSYLYIPSNSSNNNTIVVCKVIDTTADVIYSSTPTNLTIQGKLDAPKNFSVSMSSDSDTNFTLSWDAPFSLNVTGCSNPIFYYTICSNITIFGCKTIHNDTSCVFPRRCNSSVEFNDTSTNDRQSKTTLSDGDLIQFSLFAVNGAGNGSVVHSNPVRWFKVKKGTSLPTSFATAVNIVPTRNANSEAQISSPSQAVIIGVTVGVLTALIAVITAAVILVILVLKHEQKNRKSADSKLESFKNGQASCVPNYYYVKPKTEDYLSTRSEFLLPSSRQQEIHAVNGNQNMLIISSTSPDVITSKYENTMPQLTKPGAESVQTRDPLSVEERENVEAETTPATMVFVYRTGGGVSYLSQDQSEINTHPIKYLSSPNEGTDIPPLKPEIPLYPSNDNQDTYEDEENDAHWCQKAITAEIKSPEGYLSEVDLSQNNDSIENKQPSQQEDEVISQVADSVFSIDIKGSASVELPSVSTKCISRKEATWLLRCKEGQLMKASSKGDIDVVTKLLSIKDLNVDGINHCFPSGSITLKDERTTRWTPKTKDSNTTLHHVQKEIHGGYVPSINANFMNQRSLMLVTSYGVLTTLKKYTTSCENFPIHTYGKVIICGDSGAGKTPLTQIEEHYIEGQDDLCDVNGNVVKISDQINGEPCPPKLKLNKCESIPNGEPQLKDPMNKICARVQLDTSATLDGIKTLNNGKQHSYKRAFNRNERRHLQNFRCGRA